VSRRFLAFFAVVPVSVVSTVAALAPIPAAGQAAATARHEPLAPVTKGWTPPRTPDGQPDLQGVWVNLSATPFERPKALADRQLLSDDEVAELKRRADRLFKDGNADLPVGDNLFLAALANLESFRNPNGANRSSALMIEREFDNRTSLIVDPPDGRMPAFTPQAQQRRAAAAAKDRAPAGPEEIRNITRCTTAGLPRIGPAATGDPQYGYFQILQSPGYVVLLMESFHDARIIPLGSRPHLPGSIRLLSGDSRGRWDANTLTIDTTNFSMKSDFLGSAENLHLVERLTRVGPDSINYEITVDDSTTWTRLWTAAIRLKRTQAKIYEFACHEGNQDAMLSILANTRAEEEAGPR
jgi:hypothetical protein